MNGLNKHLGADGIRLHVQCWLTHANIQHFINKAIKFAVTFRDDVELLDQAFRHFTIVLEVVVFVDRRWFPCVPFYALVYLRVMQGMWAILVVTYTSARSSYLIFDN